MKNATRLSQVVFLTMLSILSVSARQVEAISGKQADPPTAEQLDVRTEVLVPKTTDASPIVVLTLRNQTAEVISAVAITMYTDSTNKTPLAPDIPKLLQSGQAWSTRLVVPATADSPSLEIAYTCGNIEKNSIGRMISIPGKQVPPEDRNELVPIIGIVGTLGGTLGGTVLGHYLPARDQKRKSHAAAYNQFKTRLYDNVLKSSLTSAYDTMKAAIAPDELPEELSQAYESSIQGIEDHEKPNEKNPEEFKKLKKLVDLQK